jgi:hypothetical protein
LNLAGPHAVVSVRKKDGSLASFSYDANGNLFAGDGRTVTFDPADRPVHVAMGAVTSDFFYAPDGARYAQRETGSSEGARTIYYVGKDFERVYWDDGRIEERSYIGPSVVVYRRGAGAPRCATGTAIGSTPSMRRRIRAARRCRRICMATMPSASRAV